MSHPDIYLQGDAVRHADIRRDARGLALLNALRRLAEGYEGAAESTRQQLAIAESQLRDFQNRLGAPFPHDEYLKQLSALREQLKIALSGAQAKEAETASDIVERIKGLRNRNSLEPSMEREARTIAAEEPVTSRILRRAEGAPPADPEADDGWQRRLAGEARANADRVREPG
jgi:hypothetical protein